PVKSAEEYHYVKAASWLRKCCDEAKKHKKKLLMEIHFGGIIENGDSTLKLLKLIDRDNIGITYDPANWLCQGVEYDVEMMKRLYKYLWHFHVKDVKILKEKIPGCVEVEGRFSEFVALGQGDMEYKQYFKELKKNNYGGYITIESHAAGWDLKDLAKHDNELVRKLWAEA
ncbi:MAG: sugar phosphate isomerase/epimerase, partial [Candidatus Firestonebacteria bacterium]